LAIRIFYNIAAVPLLASWLIEHHVLWQKHFKWMFGNRQLSRSASRKLSR